MLKRSMLRDSISTEAERSEKWEMLNSWERWYFQNLSNLDVSEFREKKKKKKTETERNRVDRENVINAAVHDVPEWSNDLT